MYLGLKQSGLTLGEAADFCGGELFGASKDARFFSYSTDSRKIAGGELFFALCGEKFDAHKFVPDVISAGALCAVVSKPQAENIPHILVADTRAALGAFAKNYYARFRSLTVGVTGSVGKTTTKEFIAAVLAEKYETAKTQGNFNNEIGLPMTLLAFEAPHNALVAEMGMSARGEISRLTRLARPDIAVITNIGSSHLENLGTRENIALAKLEITEGLSAEGLLIANGDEPLLAHAKSVFENTVFVSLIDKNCDYFAYNIKEEAGFTSFTYNSPKYTGENAKIPAAGRHNVYNALCAVAVGEAAGLTREQISAGLLAFTGAAMRAEAKKRGDVTVVEDCYNANPDSMKAALNTLGAQKLPEGARKIAVLGDMLELGTVAESSHYEIGKLAAEKADLLFCYGELSRLIAAGAWVNGMKETAFHFETKEELSENLRKTAKSGDMVWLKASRGMRFEDIAEAFYEET